MRAIALLLATTLAATAALAALHPSSRHAHPSDRARASAAAATAAVAAAAAGGGGAKCSITATPNPIPASMAPVTVSWQIDTTQYTPTADDVLAIYVPSSSPDSAYIGYAVLSERSATWATGSGSATFELANMRAYDYQFRLFSALPRPATPHVSDKTNRLVDHYHRLPGGTVKSSRHATAGGDGDDDDDGAAPLCASGSVTFANPNEPLQGHWALHATDPSALVFMFVSGDNATAPAVQWGTRSGGPYPSSATGTSRTYTIDDMCAAPANTTDAFRDPGQLHTVVVAGLTPGATYWYRYGHADTGNWSPELSFVMHYGASAQWPAGTETSVLAFGDLGATFSFQTPQEQYPYAVRSTQWMVAEAAKNPGSPHLVLHIGDLSYARGYAYQWEYFLAQVAPLAQQFPYMVSIGNHEYDWLGQAWRPNWADYESDSGGECGVPYGARFTMPTPANQGPAEGNGNLFYAFDYGHIHFAIFSAEHDFTAGSAQLAWLAADLAAANTPARRAVTPWLVVASHRPFYSSSDPGAESGLRAALKQYVEPVLVANAADVYLAGHVHAYERTCGVRDATCAARDEDAPVHVTIGMAGNDYMVPWIVSPTDPHRYPQPAWSVFRSLEFGYTHIRANATHFSLAFNADNRGETHDRFTLAKA